MWDFNPGFHTGFLGLFAAGSRVFLGVGFRVEGLGNIPVSSNLRPRRKGSGFRVLGLGLRVLGLGGLGLGFGECVSGSSAASESATTLLRSRPRVAPDPQRHKGPKRLQATLERP